MSLKGLLIACLAFAFPAVSLADVRLQTHATNASVLVTPGPHGPWSGGRWHAAHAVLNPAGDSLGDGYPGVAAAGQSGYAAWLRPMDGSVHVARGETNAWRTEVAWQADHAIGIPVLLALRDAMAVGWRELSGPDTASKLVLLAGDDLSRIADVTDSRWLVDAAPVGESLHLFLIDVDTATLYVRVISMSPIDDPPIDINERADVALATLGPHVISVGASPLPTAALPLRAQTEALHWASAADLRVVSSDSEEEPALATWWSAPRELSFVELTAWGPVLPVEALAVEHGPEHPQRLVTEATRIVSDRH